MNLFDNGHRKKICVKCVNNKTRKPLGLLFLLN